MEVVGYDIRESVPYYILRNSWGTDYGINGYLHVAMGNNLCGKLIIIKTFKIDFDFQNFFQVLHEK